MVCASCGVENRGGSKFCDNCGSPLAATCPHCGAPNRNDARFCATCGQTLGTSEAATAEQTPTTPASAERRLVTVLFTDLVGFTSLAEDRDPEAVSRRTGARATARPGERKQNHQRRSTENGPEDP